MKLILLPGLDGTGELFYPLTSLLKNYDLQIIIYPDNKKMSYAKLIMLVKNQLPKEEEYIIVAESFSGVIAYNIALEKPNNLKFIVFVATFIENPRPILSKFIPIGLLKFLLSLPLFDITIKKILLNSNASKKLIILVKNTINNIKSDILYFRLLQIINLKQVSQKISIESIYLQASKDYLVPKSAYNVFQKYIPNIHFYEVIGSHLLLQSNPKECIEIINKYLEAQICQPYHKNTHFKSTPATKPPN